MSYKFHHIAIACNDINKTAEKYKLFGYKAGKIIWDETQKVNLCFLYSKELPLIELVEKGEKKSPVDRILKKNGVTPYHICFITEDIKNAIVQLEQEGYKTISEIEIAPAIKGNKIVFMYNIDSGLIELVECNKI